MLYTLSLVAFVLAILLSILYVLRERVIPLLPRSVASYFKHYVPLATFDQAYSSGFSTNNFDLSANMDATQESREGLDAASLNEVRRLMDRYNLSFDEARLRRQQDYLRKNGIDPLTGMPLDKKAVHYPPNPLAKVETLNDDADHVFGMRMEYTQAVLNAMVLLGVCRGCCTCTV